MRGGPKESIAPLVMRGRWTRPFSCSASTKPGRCEHGLPRQHRGVQMILTAGEVQADHNYAQIK